MKRITRLVFPVVLGLLVTACSGTGDDAVEATPPPPRASADHVCDADPLTDLIGKTASTELAADALKRSGARTMRWLTPGMVVTQEFRADRLNIYLGAGNVVERVYCG